MENHPVHASYPTTTNTTYWMYDTPLHFEHYDNLRGKIQTKTVLTPNQDINCNLCYQQGNTRQCPIDNSLLYDITLRDGRE